MIDRLKARPTSIRIFLSEGTPDGVRIVYKSNWVGQAVVATRTRLAYALERPELSRAGVYMLFGPGERGAQKLYIGEADVLSERLRQHAQGKDFWTRFVAFSSTDESLNKASVRYLEARLIEQALKAKQWDLDNGRAPNLPPLSESDLADAEWFLEEMLVIVPLLGVDAFEAAESETPAESATELFLNSRGANARGREVADGFIVLNGSRARAKENSSIRSHLRDLREQLLERGVLVVEGQYLVFKQDYRFTSPSTAAGVVVGGSANGRSSWKDKQGRTLRQLQEGRTATASVSLNPRVKYK